MNTNRSRRLDSKVRSQASLAQRPAAARLPNARGVSKLGRFALRSSAEKSDPHNVHVFEQKLMKCENIGRSIRQEICGIEMALETMASGSERRHFWQKGSD